MDEKELAEIENRNSEECGMYRHQVPWANKKVRSLIAEVRRLNAEVEEKDRQLKRWRDTEDKRCGVFKSN